MLVGFAPTAEKCGGLRVSWCAELRVQTSLLSLHRWQGRVGEGVEHQVAQTCCLAFADSIKHPLAAKAWIVARTSSFGRRWRSQ